MHIFYENLGCFDFWVKWGLPTVQMLREIQPGINVPSEYDCEEHKEILLSKCKF